MVLLMEDGEVRSIGKGDCDVGDETCGVVGVSVLVDSGEEVGC
jgi:hypothetical protein